MHGEYFHLVNIYFSVNDVNSIYADQEVYYTIVLSIALFVVDTPPFLVGISTDSLDRTRHDAHELNLCKSQNLISLYQTFDFDPDDPLRIANATPAHFTWHGFTIAS